MLEKRMSVHCTANANASKCNHKHTTVKTAIAPTTIIISISKALEMIVSISFCNGLLNLSSVPFPAYEVYCAQNKLHYKIHCTEKNMHTTNIKCVYTNVWFILRYQLIEFKVNS